MKRKIIKMITLSFSALLIPVGVIFSMQRNLSSTLFKDSVNGYLAYCFGFIFLGVFLFLKSKDIKQKRVRWSKILKVLSLYWIIFGIFLVAVIIIVYILV